MHRGALLGAFALVLGACGSTARTSERSAPAAGGLEELFPAPKQVLALPADASLGTVVDAFTSATEWTVLADRDTRARLDATPAGLDRAQAVAAGGVHPFVEALLVQHGYALSVASARPPRILRLVAMEGPGARGAPADRLQVEPAELDAWAREHPAFQLQTVLPVERLDARELAVGLRPRISDADTQLMIVAGDGHALVLAGFAPWLAQMRDTVRALEQAQPPAPTEHGSTSPRSGARDPAPTGG